MYTIECVGLPSDPLLSIPNVPMVVATLPDPVFLRTLSAIRATLFNLELSHTGLTRGSPKLILKVTKHKERCSPDKSKS